MPAKDSKLDDPVISEFLPPLESPQWQHQAAIDDDDARKTPLDSSKLTPPSPNSEKRHPPLLAKLAAVFLISCISFGSHWSSQVTGAVKSILKKVSGQEPSYSILD